MAAITSTPAKSNPKLNELHVPVGETLFRAGERADSVFVITRGEMGIFASDGATLIATLSTGPLLESKLSWARNTAWPLPKQ